MIDLRKNEEMIRNGYMVIPFPAEISRVLLRHISAHIKTVTGSKEENLTKNVLTLSDDEFEKQFKKAHRMFPKPESLLLYEWAENCSQLFGGCRSGINFVSLFETKINRHLNLDSYDTFWRCVRPSKPDVGAAHQDFQFWEILKGTDQEPGVPFEYEERWKIWIPLFGCNESNSLQVLPGSHRDNIPTNLINTKNGVKPTIESNWLSENQDRFVCPLKKFSECCILFHDLLVHRGPANFSSDLRISAEFTILLNNQDCHALSNTNEKNTCSTI